MRYDHILTSLELRAAIRARFAWPGGYELFGITSDSGALCCECMRKEYKQIARDRKECDKWHAQWNVQVISSTCEIAGGVDCDHCGYILQEDESESESESE